MVLFTERAAARRVVLLYMSMWVSGEEQQEALPEQVGDIVCQAHGGMTISRMGTDSINVTSGIEQ